MRKLAALVLLGGLTACSPPVPRHPPAKLQSLSGSLVLVRNDSLRQRAILYTHSGDVSQLAGGQWIADGDVWRFKVSGSEFRDSLRWKVLPVRDLPVVADTIPIFGRVTVTVNTDVYWPVRQANIAVEVVDARGRVFAQGTTDGTGQVTLLYPRLADLLDTPEQLAAALQNVQNGYVRQAESQFVMMLLNPGAARRRLGPFRLRIQVKPEAITLPLPGQGAVHELVWYRNSQLQPWNLKSAELKPLGRDLYQLTLDGKSQQVRATGP